MYQSAIILFSFSDSRKRQDFYLPSLVRITHIHAGRKMTPRFLMCVYTQERDARQRGRIYAKDASGEKKGGSCVRGRWDGKKEGVCLMRAFFKWRSLSLYSKTRSLFKFICHAALFIQSHLWSVDNFENIFLRKNKYVMLMLQSAGTFSFIFALVRYRVKTSHQQRPLERDSAVHACTFAHWYRPESTLPSLCDYKDVGSGGCSGRCP